MVSDKPVGALLSCSKTEHMFFMYGLLEVTFE